MVQLSLGQTEFGIEITRILTHFAKTQAVESTFIPEKPFLPDKTIEQIFCVDKNC